MKKYLIAAALLLSTSAHALSNKPVTFNNREMAVIGAMETIRIVIACPDLNLNPKAAVDLFEGIRKEVKISRQHAASLAPYVDFWQREAMKSGNFCKDQAARLISSGVARDLR